MSLVTLINGGIRRNGVRAVTNHLHPADASEAMLCYGSDPYYAHSTPTCFHAAVTAAASFPAGW